MKEKEILLTLLITMTIAAGTWYINNELGYGPLIASSLVGVVAGIILPADWAGIVYTASFVGMSANYVLPSLEVSLVAGLVAGIVFLATKPVYSGVGGKGGTTAATSIFLTKAILRVFGL